MSFCQYIIVLWIILFMYLLWSTFLLGNLSWNQNWNCIAFRWFREKLIFYQVFWFSLYVIQYSQQTFWIHEVKVLCNPLITLVGLSVSSLLWSFSLESFAGNFCLVESEGVFQLKWGSQSFGVWGKNWPKMRFFCAIFLILLHEVTVT